MTFGMYVTNDDKVQRHMAEREAAGANLELTKTRRCCELLLAQREPVASLGLDREKLRVVLDFVRHHDVSRLAREVEAITPSKETEA